MIIINARNMRRCALYWFILSTDARIAEALQVRVKNIDFEQTPPLATLPAKITKRKKRTRYQFSQKKVRPSSDQYVEN